MDNSTKPAWKRNGEPIANIIANLIGLWVLSMVPQWDIAFLKPNYMVVLTIMQINCVVQIIGSVLLLIFDPRALRLLIKAGMEAAGFVVLVMLYYVYPFNFTNYHNLGWIDKVLPILLVLAMIVTIGKIISYFFILFFRSGNKTTAQE